MSENKSHDNLQRSIKDARKKLEELEKIEQSLKQTKNTESVLKLINYLNNLRKKHETFTLCLGDCSIYYEYHWHEFSKKDLELIESHGFSVCDDDDGVYHIYYPPRVSYKNLGRLGSDLKFH